MSQTPSPDTVFQNLHQRIGARLFTVTVLDRKAGLARRAFSSHPVDYPVSGTKPMGQSAWTEQVIERGERFVANTVAEFSIYFPDHALIESLGCRSALNIPIVQQHVIGTVNILDKEGYFDDERIEHCTAMCQEYHGVLVRAVEQVVL